MLDSHRVSTTQHTYNMTTTTDLNLNYANLPINVHPEVTPSSPTENQPTIGLIGMGAMGRMYAKYLGQAGWCRYVSSLSTRLCDALIYTRRIHVCDVPEKYEKLKADYAGMFLTNKTAPRFICSRTVRLQRCVEYLSCERWACCRAIFRLHYILCRSRVYCKCCCSIWTVYIPSFQKHPFISFVSP